jgi:hypothetical protein
MGSPYRHEQRDGLGRVAQIQKTHRVTIEKWVKNPAL